MNGPPNGDPVTSRSLSGPLLVCSLLRPDHPCVQARAFAAAAGRATGAAPPVEPEPLTHNGIDNDLGLPSFYTLAVDRFIAARLGP